MTLSSNEVSGREVSPVNAMAGVHSWMLLSLALAAFVPFVWPLTLPPVPDALPNWVAWICFAWIFAFWPSEGLPRALAWGWATAALVNALIATVQHQEWVRQLGPFVHAMGPDVPRSNGNLRQPNNLATLMNMGLASLIYLANSVPLTGRVDGSKTKTVARFALPLAALVMGVATGLSQSRTGILQLLIIGAVFVFWRKRQFPFAIWGAAALGLMAVNVLFEGSFQRFVDEPSICENRVIMWRNTMHLIAQKPWLGWGWDALPYAHFMADYDQTRACGIMGNAHNLLLQSAFVMGMPMTALWVGGAAYLIGRARPWVESRIDRQLMWAVMAVVFIHSLLEYPLWYGNFFFAMLCAVMVLTRPERWMGFDGDAAPAPLRPCGRRVLAILMGLFCVYAACDLSRLNELTLETNLNDVNQRNRVVAEAGKTWLYRAPFEFAVLGVTPVTLQNASKIEKLAKVVMHYSPEYSVLEKMLIAQYLQGKTPEMAFWSCKFKAAYPKEYGEFIVRFKKTAGALPDAFVPSAGPAVRCNALASQK